MTNIGGSMQNIFVFLIGSMQNIEQAIRIMLYKANYYSHISYIMARLNLGLKIETLRPNQAYPLKIFK